MTDLNVIDSDCFNSESIKLIKQFYERPNIKITTINKIIENQNIFLEIIKITQKYNLRELNSILCNDNIYQFAMSFVQ